MLVYDYVCPKCEHEQLNVIVKYAEEVRCEKCDTVLTRQHPSPNIFTTIVPTHTDSQRLKAGYVHKFGNRPATKTQVGYGGSVSKNHPTGGGKAQD